MTYSRLYTKVWVNQVNKGGSPSNDELFVHDSALWSQDRAEVPPNAVPCPASPGSVPPKFSRTLPVLGCCCETFAQASPAPSADSLRPSMPRESLPISKTS